MLPSVDNLAGPSREDDAASVASSEHSYKSTIHSHKRRLQRDISEKDIIRNVLKHGQREQKKYNKCFFF